MDELTFAATAVWHDGPEIAERWFDLVAEVVQDAEHVDPDWDSLRARLLEAAAGAGFAETAEQFVTQVESFGQPLELMRLMAEQRDDLPAAYARGLEAAYASTEPEAAATAPGSEDEGVWQEFLTAHGPRWDGTEESWPAFRDWFLYYATEQGVGETARTFCEYVESGDKVQAFAEYGVMVAAAADVAPAEPGDVEAPLPEDPELTRAVEEVVTEVAPAVLEEFRADDQFAELSDEEVRDLLAEVVREFADGGS